MSLNITDIRVRLVNKEETKVKARASITIDDCFVVHDIRVLEGTSGNYIKMPNRKTSDGKFTDIAHPIDTQTREELQAKVLAAYEKELSNQQ